MYSFSNGISIIICCHNSAERLPQTIGHIALQQVPVHIPWEVIVINNASKDDTAEIAMDTWSEYGSKIPFRVIEQPLPGLSNAREKGIESAQYEYLLFCDDDNWLNKDYVKFAYEIMEANPQIGALGGHGMAKCEVEPPFWFENNRGWYSTGPQGSGAQYNLNGEITDKLRFVYGAGTVYRKRSIEELQKHGFRFYLTDRVGKSLVGGGDIELSYALVLAGWKLWYDERLIFNHFIPKSRLTWNYIRSLTNGCGFSNIMLKPYRYLLIDKHIPSYKKTFWWAILIHLSFIVRYYTRLMVNKSLTQERINFYRLWIEFHWGSALGNWSYRKLLKVAYKEVAQAGWVHPQYKVRISKNAEQTLEHELSI